LSTQLKLNTQPEFVPEVFWMPIGNPFCQVANWLARPLAPSDRKTFAVTPVTTLIWAKKRQARVSQPLQAVGPTVLA